jgi:hypothetical protein
MKTDVVGPQEIFYNPTRLLVPLFQRPYVWKRETQWEPLWQDIVRLIEVLSKHDQNATHFLGAIVIQQVQTGLGTLPSWNVVDGQQRLTTLQVLLDAVHSELIIRGFGDLADRIQPLIENPASMVGADEERFKLWPTYKDRSSFAAVMSAENPVDYDAIEASPLRDAHSFFARQAAAWLDAGADDARHRAHVLVATLTERLEIASIRLDPQEDAQAIFETLNARGTPLSSADLIKNFVFQQIPDSQTHRAYSDYWEQFETPWWESDVTSGRVKNTRSSLFLWQWLVARTRDDIPIREVFTQFKHYAATYDGGVAALLPIIRRAAEKYRTTIEAAAQPAGELTREQLFSYRMGALNTDVARPLLIWLDEPEQRSIDRDERAQVLDVLESWFVRRALVKVSSQGSNRVIVDLLRRLGEASTGTVVDAIREFFATSDATAVYWPGDAEVRAVLSGSRFYTSYRQSVQRMLFEAIEDEKRGYPTGRRLAMGPIIRGRATIEHIMPQKWRQNWPADLTEDEQFERDQRIQHLGNLTIVTQALNTRVSNGSWQAKRTHFLETDDVLITKDAINLAGAADWNERLIEQRTSTLVDRILGLWAVPEGHVGRSAAGREAADSESVTLAELVRVGAILPGTRLVPAGSYFREGVEAHVREDGRVVVGSVAFDYPSGAARAAHRTSRALNGWWYWEIAGRGARLLHVRDEYAASRAAKKAEILARM